jgi:hypothetical protein
MAATLAVDLESPVPHPLSETQRAVRECQEPDDRNNLDAGNIVDT